MSFFGKEYAFDKQESFEDFVNGLGLPTEQAQAFINTHPNQSLTKNGDAFTMTGTKDTVFKSGVPFDETLGGRECNSTITVEGNTLNQVQKFQDGLVFTYTKTYSDDQLVVTISTNKHNVVGTRYYKAV